MPSYELELSVFSLTSCSVAHLLDRAVSELVLCVYSNTVMASSLNLPTIKTFDSECGDDTSNLGPKMGPLVEEI